MHGMTQLRGLCVIGND